ADERTQAGAFGQFAHPLLDDGPEIWMDQIDDIDVVQLLWGIRAKDLGSGRIRKYDLASAMDHNPVLRDLHQLAILFFALTQGILMLLLCGDVPHVRNEKTGLAGGVTH